MQDKNFKITASLRSNFLFCKIYELSLEENDEYVIYLLYKLHP